MEHLIIVSSLTIFFAGIWFGEKSIQKKNHLVARGKDKEEEDLIVKHLEKLNTMFDFEKDNLKK